jgi:hypothetical protein
MKLLKKLTLAAPLGAIPHDHFPTPVSTDNFLWNFWRRIKKLSRRWKQRLSHTDRNTIHTYPFSHKNNQVIDWAILVKASSSTEIDCRNKQTGSQNFTAHSLSGQSVLCVGGRIKLYPQYDQSVKSCGGCFIAFHGNPRDNLEDLPQFLKQADMIICPVDCVNHEAFLTLKCYCKYSGKPCVLLDRSGVDTFNTGIRMLVAMTA